MPPVKFDPWDQAQLTAMVKRSLTVGKEGSVSPASQIAPSVDVQSRKVKFRIVEVVRKAGNKKIHHIILTKIVVVLFLKLTSY